MSSKQVPLETQNILIKDLVETRTSAGLKRVDQALLKYALKLTQTPAAMNEADVQTLREEGFDDRGIHDICAITAYFAFVNRMADGLGVELEPRFSDHP